MNGINKDMITKTIIFFLTSINISIFAGDNFGSYLENDWNKTRSELDAESVLWAGGWISSMYLLSFQDEYLNEAVKPLYKGNYQYYFDAVDYLGYGPYSIPASIGFSGLTFLFNDQKLRQAALTSVESALVSSALVFVLKSSLGRYRPNKERGAHYFKPFSDMDASFPSGHTSTAFALITPFAVYYDNYFSYALLALPVSTAISRMIYDKHWATDVLTGGAIGCMVGYYLTTWHKDFSKEKSTYQSTPMVSFSISL